MKRKILPKKSNFSRLESLENKKLLPNQLFWRIFSTDRRTKFHTTAILGVKI